MKPQRERLAECGRELSRPFSGEIRWRRDHPLLERFGSAAKVVLFNGTFSNYNEPVVGTSAFRLLEDTGARDRTQGSSPPGTDGRRPGKNSGGA